MVKNIEVFAVWHLSVFWVSILLFFRFQFPWPSVRHKFLKHLSVFWVSFYFFFRFQLPWPSVNLAIFLGSFRCLSIGVVGHLAFFSHLAIFSCLFFLWFFSMSHRLRQVLALGICLAGHKKRLNLILHIFSASCWSGGSIGGAPHLSLLIETRSSALT